jgi:hypothetical protein
MVIQVKRRSHIRRNTNKRPKSRYKKRTTTKRNTKKSTKKRKKHQREKRMAGMQHIPPVVDHYRDLLDPDEVSDGDLLRMVAEEGRRGESDPFSLAPDIEFLQQPTRHEEDLLGEWEGDDVNLDTMATLDDELPGVDPRDLPPEMVRPVLASEPEPSSSSEEEEGRKRETQGTDAPAFKKVKKVKKIKKAKNKLGTAAPKGKPREYKQSYNRPRDICSKFLLAIYRREQGKKYHGIKIHRATGIVKNIKDLPKEGAENWERPNRASPKQLKIACEKALVNLLKKSKTSQDIYKDSQRYATYLVQIAIEENLVELLEWLRQRGELR